MTRTVDRPAKPSSSTTTMATPVDRQPGLTGPDSLGVTTESDPRIRGELQRLLEAARAVRPMLRMQQEQTERDGHYSREVHEFFLQHGFYRVLIPRAFGGLELNAPAFYQVVAEIGRGCPSTAWCLALSTGHALTLGSFWQERAQREVFEQNGYLIAPASGNGADITVERVEGGYRISGTWRYCSGAPYSTHFMPTIELPDETDPALATAWAIVPRDSYTVLDDWGRIIGMRGSGSNSIVITGAFVPDHLIMDERGHQGQSLRATIGSQLHDNSSYAGTFLGFAEGEVAAAVVGCGYAALDEYEAIITAQRDPYTEEGGKRVEGEHWRRNLGVAMGYVDCAAAIMVQNGRLHEEYAARAHRGDEPYDTARAARLNDTWLLLEKLVYDAVELLLRTAGSRYSSDGQALQRYFRDLVATRSRIDQFEVYAPQTAASLITAT